MQELSSEYGLYHPNPETDHSDTTDESLFSASRSDRRTERVTSIEASMGAGMGVQTKVHHEISIGEYTAHYRTPLVDMEQMFASVAAAATKAYQKGLDTHKRGTESRKPDFLIFRESWLVMSSSHLWVVHIRYWPQTGLQIWSTNFDIWECSIHFLWRGSHRLCSRGMR